MNVPHVNPPFFVMVKPAGARCNLDCRYCFYKEKSSLYPDVRAPAMDDDILEEYIRRYIQSQPGNIITFAWQGGEPTLLGVDFFRRVTELQRKYANGKTVQNAFQTNGVLLDDAWCTLFREHGFLVGLSIDGPEDLHNAYRINQGGGGTFAQVMRGLDYLKKHRVEFNTLSVLHKGNTSNPLRLYRFLKRIGSRFHQYIPVVERSVLAETQDGISLVAPAFPGEALLTDWSITPEQYHQFLICVFDEWVRRDVGRVYVQLFDSTLSTWLGKGAELCIHNDTCGRGLALEHNGDLYSCDHYVYPDYRLGNIMEADLSALVFSERQLVFGRLKADTLPGQCRSCEVRTACNGGCPKNRFSTTEDGEPGLNYLCAAYKGFFHHSAPYMRFMADELARGGPPARVMAWAREKDRGFPGLKVGRNDFCPCGSGRKFKKCCMAGLR